MIRKLLLTTTICAFGWNIAFVSAQIPVKNAIGINIINPAKINANPKTAISCGTDTLYNWLIDGSGTPSIYVVDAPPNDSGYVSGHNAWGDLAKAEFFANTSNITVCGASLFFGRAGGNPLNSITVNLWNEVTGKPGTILASKNVTLAQIQSDMAVPQFTDIVFAVPVQTSSNFYIGIQLSYTPSWTDTVALVQNQFGLPLANTAWEMWDDNSWNNFVTSWQSGNANLGIFAHYMPAGGCPAPTANFTFTTSSLLAAFTNTSTTTGFTAYNWTFGDSIGTLTVQNPAYTYSVAGTYNVCLTVTDSCGSNMICKNVTVTGPACNLTVIVSTTNETSVGANDGTATAVVTNGTIPYSYLWNTNPAQTNSTATALAPGVYTVSVMDANSCIASGTTVIQAYQCTLTGTMSKTNESAPGAGDGSATVSASGGTTPYTYLWNTFATTSTITNLISGAYSVTVTDAKGCKYQGSIAVNPPGCILTITLSGTAESQAGANNGSAAVTVSGSNPPVFINWNTGDTTSTISNLSPGNYSVTVIDSTGCMAAGTYTVQPGLIIGISPVYVPEISVRVYPNPAADKVNFEITGVQYGYISIYTFAGERLTMVTVDKTLTEINTAGLSNGLYFYIIINDNGLKTGSGKFLIVK